MSKKPLFLTVLLLLIFSSVSYADVCEVARAKDVLKNNLYLYLTNPSSSPLTLNEISDLLVFYLGISQDLITVDCSETGSSSSQPLSTIIESGSSAPDLIPFCSDGTEYGECSNTKPRFCYGGSIIHKCLTCGCPSGNSCNSVSNNCDPAGNITCFSNLDCGSSQFVGDYYCSSNFVARNYLNYTCINTGTSSSSCISSTSPVIFSYCDPLLNKTCVAGNANCQITATSSDNILPSVSVTNPISGSNVSGSSVTILANASDNIGVVGVQFKLDGGNLGAEDTFAPYSISWDTTTTANGAHTLTAVARDAAGNTNTSLSVFVTVSNLINQNPIAIINYSLGINLSVRFNGSLSYDPDGFITNYNWTFGDAAQSNLSVVTHSYANTGLYNVILKVRDNNGAFGNASQTINAT